MSGTTTPAAPPPKLPNPNTSMQPTPGVLHDPAAVVEGLQVEQKFAHDSLDRALERLGDTLEADDKAALVSTRALLHDGGAQDAMQTGADDLEATLYHITATLGADDLGALNAVLASMRYICNRLRTGDTLPALPDEAPPDTMTGGGGNDTVTGGASTTSGTKASTTSGGTSTVSGGTKTS